MATTPFIYSSKLDYPPDVGQPVASRAVNLQGNFDSANEFVFTLTGAGTQHVDFGTITPNGAKLIEVEVDPDPSPSAQPIMIQVNAGGTVGQVEVSPGGFWAVGNPKPTDAGVLELDIVYTTACKVRVRVLG